MELASINAYDLSFVLEAGDDGRVEDHGFVAAGALGDAGLAVVVQAPGVDFAVFVDGKGVGVAGCDVDHGFGQAELTRDEPVEFGALDDSSTELMLLAGAPGEDGSIAAKSKDVVGSCSQFCDLLQP